MENAHTESLSIEYYLLLHINMIYIFLGKQPQKMSPHTQKQILSEIIRTHKRTNTQTTTVVLFFFFAPEPSRFFVFLLGEKILVG